MYLRALLSERRSNGSTLFRIRLGLGWCYCLKHEKVADPSYRKLSACDCNVVSCELTLSS